MIKNIFCQFCIRLCHIHHTKRRVLLVTVGFCVSFVTLTALQQHNYSLNHDTLNQSHYIEVELGGVFVNIWPIFRPKKREKIYYTTF